MQTASAVAILVERESTARIIRTDGTPHDHPSLRTRNGDSIGWWEGATLVVETRNFSEPTPAPAPGESRANLRVIERFTRSGPAELHYAFFVSNPGRFTQPVQGEMVFRATSQPIFEVACHEGNYALGNILAGARTEEAAATSQKATGP